MNIKELKIEDINVIGDNPRELDPKRFEALKKYIEKYGLLTPLVVDKASQSLIGGHSRLLAVKELGWTKVTCNLVEPKDDNERKEMQLIDNEAFGVWIESELVEFVKDTEIILEDYEIQTDSISLDKMVNVPSFEPVSADEQPRLDEKKKAECPECGCKFIPK